MNKKLESKINNLISKTKAKLLSSQVLFEGSFIQVIEEIYELPDKRIIRREKSIKNNNKEAVLVVAWLKNNNFILVVQNRINNIVSIEFPAGYIEAGEDAIEAGRRELLEETGYVTSHMELMDRYYSSIGTDSQIVNVVIAYDCEKMFNQNLGTDEYINCQEFSWDELEELIDNNYIRGAGSKLAFYKLKSNKVKRLAKK